MLVKCSSNVCLIVIMSSNYSNHNLNSSLLYMFTIHLLDAEGELHNLKGIYLNPQRLYPIVKVFFLSILWMHFNMLIYTFHIQRGRNGVESYGEQKDSVIKISPLFLLVYVKMSNNSVFRIFSKRCCLIFWKVWSESIFLTTVRQRNFMQFVTDHIHSV